MKEERQQYLVELTPRELATVIGLIRKNIRKKENARKPFEPKPGSGDIVKTMLRKQRSIVQSLERAKIVT